MRREKVQNKVVVLKPKRKTKLITNQKRDHREPTDKQNVNPNAVTGQPEAMPSKYALKYSLASFTEAACRSVSHWAEWRAHPLLLCREVRGGKPKLRQGWAGMERRQHTGASLSDIL